MVNLTTKKCINPKLISQFQLLMVDPLHCGERTSCEECSVGQDPVCGWCVMENKYVCFEIKVGSNVQNPSLEYL